MKSTIAVSFLAAIFLAASSASAQDKGIKDTLHNAGVFSCAETMTRAMAKTGAHLIQNSSNSPNDMMVSSFELRQTRGVGKNRYANAHISVAASLSRKGDSCQYVRSDTIVQPGNCKDMNIDSSEYKFLGSLQGDETLVFEGVAEYTFENILVLTPVLDGEACLQTTKMIGGFD